MTWTCPANVFYTCKNIYIYISESERSFNCVLICIFNLNFVKSSALLCNSGAHLIKTLSLHQLLTENKTFFVSLSMVMIWFLRLILLQVEKGVSTRQLETPTVQFLGLWVIGVNGNDLPIHFSLINHGQDAQHFHLDDLTWKTHLKTRPIVGVMCEIM